MNRSPDPCRRGLLQSMAAGSILWPALVSELLAEDSAPSRASAADPLAPRDDTWEREAVALLLDPAPVSLARAAALVVA